MNSIRVKNLRSLADTRYVDIKPISLFLGENSSGKSTLLRVFPLLRQSFEAITAGPLLWFGRFVDFGSFEDAIYSKAKDNKILFGFKYKMPPTHLFGSAFYQLESGRIIRRRGVRSSKHINLKIELNISKGSKREDFFINDILLEFVNHKAYIEFENGNKIKTFKINESDLADVESTLSVIDRSGLIPEIEVKHEKKEVSRRFGLEFEPFSNTLMDEVKSNLHKNIQKASIFSIVNRFMIGDSNTMLLSIQEAGKEYKSWIKNTSKWTTKHQKFIKLRDLIIANSIIPILRTSKLYIRELMETSYYIAPIRATAERYYRLQNLAVNEIDYKGQNLAMFLRSLTDTEKRKFSDWMKNTIGFSVTANLRGGHISINLSEEESTESFNLADKGFGFSQILPIITQLWIVINRSTRERKGRLYTGVTNSPIIFAIEQPELHLHPRLQALLADVFINAIKESKERNIDLRLIIETHSEVIVNRIGHRVAKKDIDSKDISIALFEKKNASEPTVVKTGEFDSEGFLINWPFGFFEPDAI